MIFHGGNAGKFFEYVVPSPASLIENTFSEKVMSCREEDQKQNQIPNMVLSATQIIGHRVVVIIVKEGLPGLTGL